MRAMQRAGWRVMAALGVAVVAVVASSAPAAVKTEPVKYKSGDTEFVGFLAYDDAAAGKRPGVLVAPEWVGLNDYARGRARQLAGMGYVAFVFDPYGGGKNAPDMKEAAAWSGELKKNRKELRARVNAAHDVLRKHERVDPAKTAAIGYCFGGTSVLELARSGADVAAVVSFHGGLGTDMPAKAGEVKAAILVCHGADDPHVPNDEVVAFWKEMQAAKTDWRFDSYGNAVHSFTNPEATARNVPGVAYNEKADKRSWEAMKDLFGEVFGTPEARAEARPAAGGGGGFLGLGGRSENARTAMAKVDVASIGVAIDAFELDTGRYPSTDEGLAALVAQPAAGANGWKGPYLKRAVANDPWGHPYQYRNPGAKNKERFDLFSTGPDGREGGGDDVGNW